MATGANPFANPFDGSFGNGGAKELNHVYPHHFECPMPDWDPLSGFRMQKGVLKAWHVQVGDEIKVGTTLFDVEVLQGSKRAKSWSIRSRQDGYLATRFAKEGQTLPAGYPVGLVVEDDFDVKEFTTFKAPDLVEWQSTHEPEEDIDDVMARGGRLKEKLLAPQLKEKARFKWTAVGAE
jgi:pyruvate/2-oxoglutarate dehydrogenase complex dihydrolipoamide acyltransferase (E2) component